MAPTPDWIDLTPALRFGVYILKYQGRVMYVGSGRVPLERIANHRVLEKTFTDPRMPFRGVRFDEVQVRASHPDRVKAEVAELIRLFDPPANRKPESVEAPRTMVRRV